MNIFEYKDYKTFIEDWIRSKPQRGHGLKSKLASAIQCNTTYVTQILNGKPDFSPEQAEAASRFFGLAPSETRYFLLLVQLGRAGTPPLRAILLEQVEQSIETHNNFKNRLEYKKTLNSEDQATYYSSWYYAAIHVALLIPNLQTRESLGKYFGLSSDVVIEVLGFLVSSGLAIEENGRFRIGSVSIHLSKDSPNIFRHHTNWRVKSIQTLDNRSTRDLRYSSVITINSGDEQKIRSILIEAVEKVRGVVNASSPEDGTYCYSIDFLNLQQG